MPGSNCAFYGCSTSRKHKLSLFRIPTVAASDSDHTKSLKQNARAEWLRLILRTRESTPELQKRIDANNIYICELHFKQECILTGVRKTLITGSVPTERLPERSKKLPKRERRKLVQKEPEIPAQDTVSTSKVPVQSIKELAVRLQQEDIEPWQLGTSNEEEMRIELTDSIHDISKYTVVVNSALEFTLFVFHWPVPDENPLYKENKRSVKNIDVVDLLRWVESSAVCDGLAEDGEVRSEVMSIAVDPTEMPGPSPTSIVRHSVPKSIGVEDPYFEVSLTYWAVGCQVLTGTEHSMKSCKVGMSALNAVKRAAKAKSKSSAAPAKPRAPLSACGPEKLRATVVSSRLQVKDLEDRLQELQSKIQQHGIGVSEALEKDILTIMGGQSLEATPHMKFFWQEQMKLLQSSKMGRRYHPQVIRFALSIRSKSPSAYRELRGSGALILPSERVLRDYKNYFKPKAGISKDNVESLREKTSSFSPVQKYVAIIMDEMKIQGNLVFGKVS